MSNIKMKKLLKEDEFKVSRGRVKMAYLNLEVVNKMLAGVKDLDIDKLDKIKRMLRDVAKELRETLKK